MATDYERKIAKRFIDLWSEQRRETYSILDGPDPPDFLLDSRTQKTWLEVTDIYRNQAQGKFMNCSTEKTYAFFGDPSKTAESLINQLSRKLGNPNYRKVFEQRGAGMLLLTCQDCVFDEVNLARVDEGLLGFKPFEDQGFFNIAYFEYRLPDGRRFYDEIYAEQEIRTGGSVA